LKTKQNKIMYGFDLLGNAVVAGAAALIDP